jgi:hypothetical protein
MLAKYHIEYAVPFHRHEQPHQHLTNDPVACEEFLTELLERGFKIKSIAHEGVALSKVDFDRMIKTAAGVLTTRTICRSLGIDSAEAHHRFGSPA